jgi:hypothetical protein
MSTLIGDIGSMLGLVERAGSVDDLFPLTQLLIA